MTGPNGSDRVETSTKGDIIKCDCGKRWECTAEEYSSDQREGSSWTTLKYKEVVEFHGIYASGTK